MIKNTIYIRELSETEKKILTKIAAEHKIGTGVDVIKFMISDYNSKITALSYQSKILKNTKQELEQLKESYKIFVELEQKKIEAFENLKKNINL